MCDNNIVCLYTDYTSFAARMTSLNGLPFAGELAKIGVYLDAWNGYKITCHKCDLIFQIDDIFMMMERDEINFEEAGWLIHIIHHPCCDLVKSLKPEYRNRILGIRFIYLTLNYEFEYVKYNRLFF